jgi:DNA-binding MarR family transcriptional regulator
MKTESRRREISEIINSIRLLQGISRRQTREFVQKHRITGQQLGALRIVAMSPGISLCKLSERLFLHVSTVSGIVDRLEKKGYAVRERGGADRRVVQINITSDGRKVIRRTPLAGMGLLIHTIDRVPDGDLHDILKGLRLLLAMMKIELGRATN